MSIAVGTVGRAIGAAGSSGCRLCSLCGAFWTAGFGGGGRATGLGGLGWRVAFGGFFAVASAILLQDDATLTPVTGENVTGHAEDAGKERRSESDTARADNGKAMGE